jgi:glycine cleavage system H protein
MAETVWQGCVVPDDRYYDLELHVWVQLDGDEVVLGMTDVAQTMGGKLVQLSWKRVGHTYERGQTLAVVESAKWVGPFPTALSGTLVAVNPAVTDDVVLVNRDPYGAGWLARIRPSDLDGELAQLTPGEQAMAGYRQFIDDREIRCYRCAD